MNDKFRLADDKSQRYYVVYPGWLRLHMTWEDMVAWKGVTRDSRECYHYENNELGAC